MQDGLKRRAAEAALAYVEDGMKLGLGTGSTAAHFITILGQKVAEGLRVSGAPTSKATAQLALSCGIPLLDFDDIAELDLAVDGADEIGPGLALIKGGGGALLREKIVASAAARVIIIADAGKRVEQLGASPLPLEVVPFGLAATRKAVQRAAADLALSVSLALRKVGGGAFVTDNGNQILDASFGRIPDPEALALRLANIPGVVEHGLFVRIAHLALVASERDVAEVLA